ncbi:MAG: s-adenosyl-l-methionine-dependent methyltransferase [Verrucomicrobiaceae bacterium]|nr:s-adenosyl-l-methionine-dependent methyltransferase [Verrucomicrobiaceae bacterium]
MRIISGLAGGIPIKVPAAVARPTTDKVRQAMFSMLGDVNGARVLDLFAGSGALGLEALSRGAASALFVDESRQAGLAIRDNLAKSRLQGGQLRQGEAMRVLADMAKTQPGSFDLVFADPPYAHSPKDVNWSLKLLQSDDLKQVLAEDGSVIIECKMTKDLILPSWGWTVVRDREYGDTRLLWLQKSKDAIPPT